MPQVERRIGEAEKLGFKEMVVPKANVKSLKKQGQIKIHSVEKLGQAVGILMN